MATKDGLNLYVNFLLYAIAGAMGAADEIMRQYGAVIRETAAELLPREPIGKVYRGVLVDPQYVTDGVLAPDTRFTFVSYSRNRDVARWFADRDSFISEYFKLFNNPQGYLAECEPAHSDVLFCAATQPRLVRLLKEAAQYHLSLPADQIVWNLDVQDEVILLQDARTLRVEPYSPCDTAELDKRFCPPWIDRGRKEGAA